jgi:pyruvate kinase
MTIIDKAPNVSSRVFKGTKILATLGPATHTYEIIRQMMKTGVNGFRLNFSHGDHPEHAERLEWVRRASAEVGKPVTVLLDLQGPKIRLGDFEGQIDIKGGDAIQLGYGTDYAKTGIIPVQYDLSKKVKVGERIYLFDGRLRGIVSDVQDGVLTVQIDNNGYLVKRKGINLPDTDFGGDILTAKDMRDIEFGLKADIDYVGLSFVQTADDIIRLRAILQAGGSDAKIIAKIETRAAVEDHNLEEIVKVSDAVMVARGDLAVEVDAEAVPIIQRRIIGLCQQYGKISIVATQMLISMVDNPEPTRAEVSDVANAVITGADCVMLSDETTIGKYPLDTIATMKRIILYTQANAPLRPIFYQEDVGSALPNAISAAVMTLAHQIKAAAIVAETKSGNTALNIASHRPNMPIVVVTSTPRVATQLALMYASKTFLRDDISGVGATLAAWLKEQGVFTHGDRVVIVSGKQPGLTGGTDTIKVRVLE